MSPIRMLRADQEAEWLAALGDAPRHDFYHLPQYHALAEERGEGEACCLVHADGPYTIALPLLLRPVVGHDSDRVGEMTRLESYPTSSWRDATSVYGYAGPVASHDEIPAAVLNAFRTAVHARLEALGVVAVFSRLHPLLPQRHLLSGLGECKVTNQTVSIDLRLPPEAQRGQYRKNHKLGINKLRRAGVTCELDPDGSRLDEFVALYHETMRRVGAGDTYFFPADYFRGLYARLRSRVSLFVCLYQGRTACAALFLRCGGILQYHLGGTRDDFLPLAPMKVLVDEVRQWASAQGLSVLHLGGGTTSRPDDSLLHFKTGFSDRRHDFAVWRWVLLPEVYRQLCQARSRWVEGRGLRPASPEYFPAYRCPAV